MASCCSTIICTLSNTKAKLGRKKCSSVAGKERLAPVLMTALTSGIGLVPLAMSAGEPGKEILYPVATVILGGLISSTILEFFRPSRIVLDVWAKSRTPRGRRIGLASRVN